MKNNKKKKGKKKVDQSNDINEKQLRKIMRDQKQAYKKQYGDSVMDRRIHQPVNNSKKKRNQDKQDLRKWERYYND